MLRFIVALIVLTSYSSACQGGFASCKVKIDTTNVMQGNALVIPISASKSLVYANVAPASGHVIKHDPFLSLYLIENNKKSKYHFQINKYLTSGTASVDGSLAIEGKILKRQEGLNRLATFSEAVFAPSLLLNSCCFLEGIVTPQGIIEKSYIERFIYAKEETYADIGIRLQAKNGKVTVRGINPFVKDNPFEVGDVLLRFNNKKIVSVAMAMQEILFSKINARYGVQVQRNQQTLEFFVVPQKRYGGGRLSDTFLETKGIYFDTALKVVKIDEYDQKNTIALGDIVLGVNGVLVHSQQELLDAMGQAKETVNLLLQRGDFQFFVQIN